MIGHISYYQKKKLVDYPEKDNSELSTYGDAVIKLAYSEILLDKVKQLSIDKAKYESDGYLVTKVAYHYDMLKFLHYDFEDEKIIKSYNYNNNYKEPNNHRKGNKLKYIATAVEAIIGAIYKETSDLDAIKELLKTWMDCCPYKKD